MDGRGLASGGSSHRYAAVLLASTLMGIALGGLSHGLLPPAASSALAGYLAIITDGFLRLIRMIIAPLVFASLTSAVARMGTAADIGRLGLKALLWFLAASCISLLIGLSMATLLQPGVALHASGLLASPAAISGVDAGFAAPTLPEFVNHVIPRSIIEAMANNEILQVVVFSLFVGTAAASLREQAGRLVELLEQLSAVMFRITDYVMKLAPLAIFAALAGSISLYGFGIVQAYARFVGGFYLSLGVLWLLFLVALWALGGRRALGLVARIRQPVLLAFATSSSEAAYPRLLEELVAFGVPRRIAAFVLPLGYSFNLDGAMMYCTFAILFIAQAYHVELAPAQQLALFGLLLISTKGLAGVPRAAIAVIAVTLHYFHLPDAGLALVLAVDHLLDMGRSATNIVGNAVASVAVATWEGGLDTPSTSES
ncbi:dicarboxylate/amino acid:cation symporter [Dyella sp. C9]|uniref:dicarboxylate/amino acid:cation symporter n=1 Tax=Dyella sp. C9 TaxID=2202154 RepID=UPI000DEF7316|nr:dicarboxylate/amino acid:cation symporter [Dyella sp. C9]